MHPAGTTGSPSVPDYEPGGGSGQRQYALLFKDLPSRAERAVYTNENDDVQEPAVRKPRTRPPRSESRQRVPWAIRRRFAALTTVRRAPCPFAPEAMMTSLPDLAA